MIFDTGPNGDLAGFVDPSEVIVAWDAGDVADAFARIEAARAAGKWLAGLASYELGYVFEPRLTPRMPAERQSPLLCFGVFDGVDMAATRGLMHRAQSEAAQATLDTPSPKWSADEYGAAFAQVADYIAAGDFYQTNLTFPMDSKYTGSPLGLYAALRHGQPVNYGGIVQLGQGPILVSRSPELFFKVDAAGVISTRPMKGTVPRGKTAGEDADLKAFLQSDEKNRAENLMIVDLLRNDISRVAKVGSVRVPELFTIESYATVHQMTSLVEADLQNGLCVEDLFQALFPCGSITGAPKLRAMEVINDLEPFPREIYCGSIGWIAPSGEMAFNVAIRTLSLFGDQSVRLNVGGGVVYDSTADSEYEEALWKARYTKIRPMG
ncbi:aminodeoxychorismate synthase, component I [Amylibacter kogurei]|uniref:Aminodeoxychorismate synthase, component I n=1 Tax=Paramylibacter kogurei TaxID=1889778 RepID=A0A2G5K693_9RHOB|nr:aminodeoxychorismate synthase, component I [Amylibacter kogurei]